MNVTKQPLARTARWLSTTKPWTCPECRVKRVRIGDDIKHRTVWRRPFSSTIRRRDEEIRKPITPLTTTTTTETNTPASTSTSLPSHTAKQRSEASQRLSKILDELLARASVASQHINAYTGTDYSGIEALRREITEQEQKVKQHHRAVEDAKSTHHDAHAKQTSAQREIVGLLERKSSWSPSDLERYMSLVRSEHLNERDVQVARENLTAAERNLEDARALLEKLERKQYHEEQVWSDTIRRNSTWVTFGLMGVNILLLLANIAIFEPWRRKKIVRDVKSALDERTLTAAPAATTSEQEATSAVPAQAVALEQTEPAAKQPLDDLLPAETDAGKTPLAAGEMLPAEASDFAGAVPTEATATEEPSALPATTLKSILETYQERFMDLFSERVVQLRKVDVTSTALQGAASGAAIVGLMFLLLRPR